jgi:hypothetical protein
VRKIPDHLRSAVTDKKRIVKGFANFGKLLKKLMKAEPLPSGQGQSRPQ